MKVLFKSENRSSGNSHKLPMQLAMLMLFYGVATSTGGYLTVFLQNSGFAASDGLLLAGGMNYVYSLAPDELKTSAQTIIASVTSCAGIFGNAISGFAIEVIGVSRFYVILGLISLSVTALYILSFAGQSRHSIVR
jgi:predicted MFS family arabinose efflux permease